MNVSSDGIDKVDDNIFTSDFNVDNSLLANSLVLQRKKSSNDDLIIEKIVTVSKDEECLRETSQNLRLTATSLETAKTVETVNSGESLFKHFYFNPSKHDQSITNKCLSFWKTVYNTPQLQPCPCTFITAQDQNKKQPDDVETNPKTFDINWYDVLLEFQRRKMDDLAFAATCNTCKMCDKQNSYYKFKRIMHPKYTCSELKEHDDIICLNDWNASAENADADVVMESEPESRASDKSDEESDKSDEEVNISIHLKEENLNKRGAKCVTCGMKKCACFENEQKKHSITKSLDKSVRTSGDKSIRTSIDNSKRLCKCGVVGCNCSLCDNPDNNEPSQKFSFGSQTAPDESSDVQHTVSVASEEDTVKVPHFCSKCGLDECYCGICTSKMPEDKKKNSINSTFRKGMCSKEVIGDSSKFSVTRGSAKLGAGKHICTECGVENCCCTLCHDLEDPTLENSSATVHSEYSKKHDVSQAESFESTENEEFKCLNCGLQQCCCTICNTNDQNEINQSRLGVKKYSLDLLNNLKKVKPHICNECGVEECKCNLCTHATEEENEAADEEDVPLEIILPNICKACGVRYCKCRSCNESNDEEVVDEQDIKRASLKKSPITGSSPVEEHPRTSRIGSNLPALKKYSINTEETPISKTYSAAQPKKHKSITVASDSSSVEEMSQWLFCEKCGKGACSCNVCNYKIPHASEQSESLSEESKSISEVKSKSKQSSLAGNEDREVCCAKYGTKECPCQICVPQTLKSNLRCEFCGPNCKCWEHKVNNARLLLDDLKYNSRYEIPSVEDKSCSIEKFEDEDVKSEDKIMCFICGKLGCDCKKQQRPKHLLSFDFGVKPRRESSIVREKMASKTLEYSKFSDTTMRSSITPSQKASILTFKDFKQRTTRKESLNNQQLEKKLVLTPEQRAKNMATYNRNVIIRMDKYDIPQVVKYKDGRSIPKVASSDDMLADSLESLVASINNNSSEKVLSKPWTCGRNDENGEPETEIRFGRKL